MIEAPNRLSANGEHGFPTPNERAKVRVTLNGDSRRSVMAYDVDDCWVESYCMDNQGYVLFNGDKPVCKREYGLVKAIIIE